MTRLTSNLHRLMLLLLLLAAYGATFAQGCACPSADQCSPCAGGINSMTLQYNGSTTTLVTVMDGLNVVYLGILSPGSAFTITGPAGNKFNSPQLLIYSPGLNPAIPSNCSFVLDPAFSYGSINVLRASSKNGGNLCCASGANLNEAPEFTNIPSSINASAGAACTATVTWTPPSVVECNLESLTSTYQPGAIFPIGSTIVTYTATDEDGQSATCSFTVTVRDNSSPVLSTTTPDVTVQANANCMAIASWTPPVFTDNCNLTVTSTHNPGASFSLGTTNVTYTARDNQGNTTAFSFKVIVKDMTSPVVTNCPGDIIVNQSTSCSAIVSWTPPTFTDNCPGTVVVSSNYAPNTQFPVGSTTVTYTARDNVNNTTACSFKVIVRDTSSPIVSNCPANIILDSTTDCMAVATWTAPAFTDNCGLQPISKSHEPGGAFPIGTTTVSYTATDFSGNSTVCSFTVTVKDLIAPVISECPQNIVIQTSNQSGTAIVDWTPPEATDDCQLASLLPSHESGSSFPVGLTTVTYTAKDSFGNITRCSFNVNVVWETIPLDITQLVTPDGNGENDQWLIGNIQKYEINKVVIVDRWGNVIYTEMNYDNDRNVWDGRNSKGNIVPTGTYFYTITTKAGPNIMEKRGFIEVVN